MQPYDLSMKIAFSSEFFCLPLEGVERGTYHEMEIKQLKAAMRADAVIDTDKRRYVIEFCKSFSREEAEEAALKAHLLREGETWAVVIAMKGGAGEKITSFHWIFRTSTRCDVDVFEVNGSFIDAVVGEDGISGRMREREFWEKSERAVDVLGRAGRIVSLWLDEELRNAAVARAKREGMEIWKDLYIIATYLNVSGVKVKLEKDEMREVFERIIRNGGDVSVAFDAIARIAGPERAYELAAEKLGEERAFKILVKKMGKKKALKLMNEI